MKNIELIQNNYLDRSNSQPIKDLLTDSKVMETILNEGLMVKALYNMLTSINNIFSSEYQDKFLSIEEIYDRYPFIKCCLRASATPSKVDSVMTFFRQNARDINLINKNKVTRKFIDQLEKIYRKVD
jgi:hypothetical protein